MRRLLAFVFHATAASIMAWGWFSLGKLETVDTWMKSQTGGYYQFLTNQGLIITWSCMATSLFCDLFPSVVIFRRIKRALLMTSMPVEFVVTTIYWSLLLLLPHLIMRPLDGRQTVGAPQKLLQLPLLVDLALHLSPLSTALIDFFFFEPKYSRGAVRKAAPAVVITFTLWYALFVEYCATFNGSFPYPFLTHSPLVARVLIYATSAVMALGTFNVLNSSHA